MAWRYAATLQHLGGARLGRISAQIGYTILPSPILSATRRH
ncbi:hypothetical protein EV650_7600 [Kribbella kalugense]|uniref:Uncharacterized protein n=1 Tax=Kribbella kalugense TaxID=2512221 RepID=A0A4R7ZGB8_9ACTN|nr:hypothetical protein EV650_7600 [Kribbella kalugense]